MSEQAAECRRQAVAQAGSVLLEDSRPVPGRSLFFTEPLEWLEAWQLHELPALFERLATARRAGLWTAGYLSYECGYHWEPTAAPGFAPSPGGLPLAAFGVYAQPLVFVSGPGRTAAGRGIAESSFSLGPENFAGKISRIHRWIEAGDTYQANLTGVLRARFAGDAAALFTHMMEAQPVPFGALLRVGERCILSASPELLFHLRAREITVRPMKGTAARGRDPAEDIVRAGALAADAKNRAENIMIVDLLRNDLGRVAEMGSVRVEKLFAVERFPSLLQMTSEITARLRPEVDAYALFASLFPSGSIVGAPKVRTMGILRELERRERGVYTGAIGYFAPDGEAVFSVAIRTAVLRGKELEMGVGAGITYDSEAGAEYAECLLKGEFLREPEFGLIETMRWESGACALLERHLDRLEASAACFRFPFRREEIGSAVENAGAALPAEGAWKLRLVMARDGKLTFSPPQTVAVDVASVPGIPLRAMLWPERTHSADAWLRHKVTRRAVYEEAVRVAQQQGYVDALFQNEQGMVTEGAIHNVAVRHGSRWRTPPLAAGVLPGVYRAHLLATMPGMAEENFTVAELVTADEVWLFNAVRGVRKVAVEHPSDRL